MGTPELTLCLKDSQVLSPGKAGPVCQIFTFFFKRSQNFSLQCDISQCSNAGN